MDLCRNIASLHEFVTIGKEYSNAFEHKTISEPIRVLNTLKNYEGEQNLVKIWEYISMKEYIDAFPQNSSQRNHITAEIKNYSNLILKDNQEEKFPLLNHQNLLSVLKISFPFVEIDQQYEDYYVNLIIKMKLKKAMNLITINEPLCPSSKL